jgi:neuropeptide Y receptor
MMHFESISPTIMSESAETPPPAYYNLLLGDIFNITGTGTERNGNKSNEYNETETYTTFSREFVEDKLVQIIFCMIYTSIFILGLTGNMLVCFVVVRNRAMHTVTNLFITNLALSDILLCILAVPFTPLYTFTGNLLHISTV